MYRVFRVRIARLASLGDEGPPIPLFSVIDYVTAEDEQDALAVVRRVRPELADRQMVVEEEVIAQADLWVVFFPVGDPGAEVYAVVVVEANTEDDVPAALLMRCGRHPVLGPKVCEGAFTVRGTIDRKARAAWA